MLWLADIAQVIEVVKYKRQDKWGSLQAIHSEKIYSIFFGPDSSVSEYHAISICIQLHLII